MVASTWAFHFAPFTTLPYLTLIVITSVFFQKIIMLQSSHKNGRNWAGFLIHSITLALQTSLYVYMHESYLIFNNRHVIHMLMTSFYWPPDFPSSNSFDNEDRYVIDRLTCHWVPLLSLFPHLLKGWMVETGD